MLNYVWLGLLMLGIGVALTTDIIDKGNNKYQNGETLAVEIIFDDSISVFENKSYSSTLIIGKEIFNKFYDVSLENDISQSAQITFDNEKNKKLLFFNVNDDSPKFWKEMA